MAEDTGSWRSHHLGQANDLELAQGTLRYFDAGSGPPIVFVHGALANANLWRKVVAELSSGFRCVALDLPFGAHTTPLPPEADLSPPAVSELIADAIEKLDLTDVTLVGNDTGGGCTRPAHRARGAHTREAGSRGPVPVREARLRGGRDDRGRQTGRGHARRPAAPLPSQEGPIQGRLRTDRAGDHRGHRSRAGADGRSDRAAHHGDPPLSRRLHRPRVEADRTDRRPLRARLAGVARDRCPLGARAGQVLTAEWDGRGPPASRGRRVARSSDSRRARRGRNAGRKRRRSAPSASAGRALVAFAAAGAARVSMGSAPSSASLLVCARTERERQAGRVSQLL